MHRSGERRISCKRCQTRKIKCSRMSPCSHCSTAGVPCEFRANDWRRSPASPDYVAALENQIAALECLLSSIKSSSGDNRELLIESIRLDRYSPKQQPSHTSPDYRPVSHVEPGLAWGFDCEANTLVFHAPGSAYATGLFQPYHQIEAADDVLIPGMDISRCPCVVLQECASLFFMYQRPFCTIVSREEIEQQLHGSLRDDQPLHLLHGVCALGALMSTDRHIRELAGLFAASAETKLLETPFWHSRLETAQAMLLVAVFAAGKGHVSKAWMFSGMAIRMVQNLGLADSSYPNVCPDLQSAQLGSNTTELQLRMSLTITISDKSLQPEFLGFFYGRKPQSSSHPITTAPAPSSLTTSPSSTDSSDRSGTLVPVTLLAKQVELLEIVQEIQSHALNYTTLHQSSAHWLEAICAEINTKLSLWHETLPSELRWSRWSSNTETIDPVQMDLHMLFHTAKLSLLRLSLKDACPQPAPPNRTHSKCSDSIEAVTCLITRFHAQHTLRAAPLSFVHGAVAAADALLTLSHLRPELGRTHLPSLTSALREMGKTWHVAADAEWGVAQAFSPMQSSSSLSASSGSVNPAWHSAEPVQTDLLSLFDVGCGAGRYAEDGWFAGWNAPFEQ